MSRRVACMPAFLRRQQGSVESLEGQQQCDSKGTCIQVERHKGQQVSAYRGTYVQAACRVSAWTCTKNGRARKGRAGSHCRSAARPTCMQEPPTQCTCTCSSASQAKTVYAGHKAQQRSGTICILLGRAKMGGFWPHVTLMKRRVPTHRMHDAWQSVPCDSSRDLASSFVERPEVRSMYMPPGIVSIFFSTQH